MFLQGLDSIDKKLIIFGGKGGVGKTSCAVTTAIHLSEKFKTLLISTDPAHSVSDCLEQEIGFKVVKILNKENLSAIEIVAEEAMKQFKKDNENQLKSLLYTSTNLDNDDIDEMLRLTIPGIDEIMSFKAIIDFIDKGEFEKYVVDTAPTGHALRLISSPKMLDQWIKVAAQMRWKYRYMVTSFSGSYKQDDVDALLFNLKKTVKKIEGLLISDSISEFIPVCIPEAMAILETQRLVLSLKESGIIPKQLIVNNVMISEGCDFCKKRKENQLKHLQNISISFPHLQCIEIPLFPTEMKGIEPLKQLDKSLFSSN